ncbi:MAG: translation initiation factor IF-2 [Patescibacteria group bacterium]
MEEAKKNGITERPPVIVITGHIDHGKSTLLDYIRKTNIAGGEVGGITQLLSAYEVVHPSTGSTSSPQENSGLAPSASSGQGKKITFLDTPGHEAFSGMRERGVLAADIAVLVVSAEDSVKAQTIEALKTIRADGIPFIVAINKIDKPSANIEKVKIDLVEQEVYLEGYGGDIPSVAISAKTGQGVPELLDMILLVAEMAELRGDKSIPASGIVIESHIDAKRGITATLVIENGTLKSGMFAVAGDAIAPTRLIEDFLGKNVKEATFSSPVTITGFNKLPEVGAKFTSYEKKKDAEAVCATSKEKLATTKENAPKKTESEEWVLTVPIIIKTDVAGSLEAIRGELSKISKEGLVSKIVQSGAGTISESDVKLASSMNNSLLVGFNVKIEKAAIDLALRLGVQINSFDIIYKLTEWLDAELEKKRPRVSVEETSGGAKILKCFSRTKDKQIVGGRVTEGTIVSGANIKIIRRDFEIGQGKILGLEQGKTKVREVQSGNEFGVSVETKMEIAPGDIIKSYIIVTK